MAADDLQPIAGGSLSEAGDLYPMEACSAIWTYCTCSASRLPRQPTKFRFPYERYKIFTGTYSGRPSEEVYEFAAKYKDCQHLFEESENPASASNPYRTSISERERERERAKERVTILKLLLTESANTFQTSRGLFQGRPNDWEEMMDATIGEFMQHKT